MHPFESATIFSSAWTTSVSKSASTLTSAMSFTMTATLRPSRLFNTCVINVVLPAPRKPLKTVTGKGLLPDAFMDSAAALTASSNSVS